MKHYRLIFLALLTAALLACQPAATTTPEARAPIATRAAVSAAPTAEPIDTAEPIATIGSTSDQWQTFSSKEGGFSLLLPGQPKEQRQPINTATGSVDAIMYITEVGNTAFGAGFSDFPGSASNVDPQQVLAGARDGAAKNVNGTVVDEKPIELAGHPGLEIAVEIPAAAAVPGGAMYRGRIYLVGNRLYQVIYVALKNDDKPDEYHKLFDSFQLDNAPAPSTSSSSTSTALKDWVAYRSDDGGYTVLLPAEPKVSTQLADTAAGSVELTMALTEMDNYAAGVSFNEIPKAAQADPGTLLAGGRDGAAKNLKGTVISDKPIKLGNYAGTEFVVETPAGLLYTARVYIVNDRLYQILFLAPKDQIDQFDVPGFFDSFNLLNQ